MYLALNNLQWLICHKTKPNQVWLWLDMKVDMSFNRETKP